LLLEYTSSLDLSRSNLIGVIEKKLGTYLNEDHVIDEGFLKYLSGDWCDPLYPEGATKEQAMKVLEWCISDGNEAAVKHVYDLLGYSQTYIPQETEGGEKTPNTKDELGWFIALLGRGGFVTVDQIENPYTRCECARLMMHHPRRDDFFLEFDGNFRKCASTALASLMFIHPEEAPQVIAFVPDREMMVNIFSAKILLPSMMGESNESLSKRLIDPHNILIASPITGQVVNKHGTDFFTSHYYCNLLNAIGSLDAITMRSNARLFIADLSEAMRVEIDVDLLSFILKASSSRKVGREEGSNLGR
jgi:hypothetical protein